MKYVAEFEDLGLTEDTLRGLERIRYEKPSDVQAKALPYALEGHDMIIQAKTGSGKTAVFAITIAESIDPSGREIQALVLSPTRELALQVTQEVNRVGYFKRVRALTIYGGQDISIQFKKLRDRPNVVVATPGRLIDHIKRGTLSLDNVKVLVIDEADKMLEIGFLEDIEFILSQTPKKKQILLLSATMPSEIMSLAKRHLVNPIKVKTSQDDLTATHIDQVAYVMSQKRKFETLIRILRKNKDKKILIFTNTKKYGKILQGKLRSRNYNVLFLSGDLTQNQRERTINNFRRKGEKILIASDVASRGLDITDIDLVINYDIPTNPRLYVHRIGRTGRFGRKGKAISLVSHEELRFLDQIKKKNNIKVVELEKYKVDHNVIA